MIEIRIVLDEQTGQLNVQAPQNIVQSYGPLEMAKDVLRMQLAQRQRIQPPVPADLALLKGGR